MKPLTTTYRAFAMLGSVLWIAIFSLPIFGQVAAPTAPYWVSRSNASTPSLVLTQPKTNTPPEPIPVTRSMEALDSKQKLGVGDKITFRVFEDQDDPKSLTVTDAGELDVPELGLVTAAGKTCKELALEIKAKLEQVTYYKATVIIGIELLNKTMSGRKVYVVGQVRLTGPQEIPAGESWTVSKAIMRAGGFTDFADKKKVRLVRGGAATESKTYIINVSEIWEKGKTENDITVEPEDLIYVPTRAVNFY